MSLGERIQQLRKARGLSQEQLADTLNVSRQAISKWETDQSSPEIENILALCRVLCVSTDRLLGNDAAGGSAAPTVQSVPETKKPSFIASVARGTLSVMNSKAIFLIFTILCFIAIGVCIIVNYAMDRRLTWAAYPILSVPVGWLIGIPLLFKKYTLSLCVLSATSIPFLYFLEKITPVHGWFFPLGLPAAIVGIVVVWMIYLLFRYIKMSLWYKFAVTALLCGVADNLFISRYVDVFLLTKADFLGYFINVFCYVVVITALVILGYVRGKMKKTGN